MLLLRPSVARRTVCALLAECSEKCNLTTSALRAGAHRPISASTLAAKWECSALSKAGNTFNRLLQTSSYVPSSSSHSQSCSNCDVKRWSEATGIVCDSCDSILNPPDHANHFKLFGIRESFDVNDIELTQRFRQMQTQLHPDRFAAKSEKERALSELWSSRLNAAYQTLKKPLGRALYLLELKGMPLAEGDISVDDEFLMAIMELNEQVAEAASAEEVSSLTQNNMASLSKYVRLVSAAFEKGQLDLAREHVATMKYYANIQEKIIQKEEELGIVH